MQQRAARSRSRRRTSAAANHDKGGRKGKCANSLALSRSIAQCGRHPEFPAHRGLIVKPGGWLVSCNLSGLLGATEPEIIQAVLDHRMNEKSGKARFLIQSLDDGSMWIKVCDSSGQESNPGVAGSAKRKGSAQTQSEDKWADINASEDEYEEFKGHVDFEALRQKCNERHVGRHDGRQKRDPHKDDGRKPAAAGTGNGKGKGKGKGKQHKQHTDVKAGANHGVRVKEEAKQQERSSSSSKPSHGKDKDAQATRGKIDMSLDDIVNQESGKVQSSSHESSRSDAGGGKSLKWLTWALRWGHEELGIEVGDGGWTKLSDIAKAMQRIKKHHHWKDITAQDLRAEVWQFDKDGHFELKDGFIRKCDKGERRPRKSRHNTFGRRNASMDMDEP